MPRRSLSEIEEFIHAQADRMRANATPEEALLMKILPKGWQHQYPMILLGPRKKVWPIIFDAYLPTAKVAVELDGKMHKSGPDGRRDRMCAFNGIQVLRYANKRLWKEGELRKIVDEIQTAVRGRLGQ
jgi:very-short-patch-repair endonuclease